jgi:hypothetical protein
MNSTIGYNAAQVALPQSLILRWNGDDGNKETKANTSAKGASWKKDPFDPTIILLLIRQFPLTLHRPRHTRLCPRGCRRIHDRGACAYRYNRENKSKWYLVNISLFASDLIPEYYKSGGISSDFNRVGSRGRARSCNITVNPDKSGLYH